MAAKAGTHIAIAKVASLAYSGAFGLRLHQLSSANEMQRITTANKHARNQRRWGAAKGRERSAVALSQRGVVATAVERQAEASVGVPVKVERGVAVRFGLGEGDLVDVAAEVEPVVVA